MNYFYDPLTKGGYPLSMRGIAGNYNELNNIGILERSFAEVSDEVNNLRYTVAISLGTSRLQVPIKAHHIENLSIRESDRIISEVNRIKC